MRAASLSDIYKTVRVTISNGTKTTITYAKYSVDEAGKAMVWVGNKYMELIKMAGENVYVEAVVTTAANCFSGSQFNKMYIFYSNDIFSDSFIVDTRKTPLILVHGWQVGPENCIEAYKSTWSNFIQLYSQDSELQDKYQLFSFSYNTSRSIEENGQILSQKLSQTFGDKPLVVLAHSMGGLVTRSALVKNNAKIHGLIMLATPNHGTILRRIDEILIKKGVTNLSKAAIAAEGAWFLTLEVEGARQLDWDNFDGKIFSCSLLPCNSFLDGLNQADNNYSKYVVFAGKDLDVLDTPLALALLTAGIPTSNDMIVPEVSALFRDYNSSTSTYINHSLKDNQVFNDIGHFKIHDDSNILEQVKVALVGFIDTPPSAPTGASATAGNGQVTISWNAISGATSYNIYWSTTSGVTKTNGTKISNVTSPYTHTGRTNGMTYYYVVTAVNSYGESTESSQVSATANGTGGVSYTW